MKFLADENVDKPIVERLRKDGHAVTYVLELERGISDDEVIQRANQASAILLTADKDFGESVFRQGRMIHGVVLMRVAGLSPQHKAEVVAQAVQRHCSELSGHFAVVTPGAIRIRKHVSEREE